MKYLSILLMMCLLITVTSTRTLRRNRNVWRVCNTHDFLSAVHDACQNSDKRSAEEKRNPLVPPYYSENRYGNIFTSKIVQPKRPSVPIIPAKPRPVGFTADGQVKNFDEYGKLMGREDGIDMMPFLQGYWDPDDRIKRTVDPDFQDRCCKLGCTASDFSEYC